MAEFEPGVYTYDQVFQASLEYFNGDELAAKVFVDKYALRDGEDNLLEKTPEDMHRRIAKEIAKVEKDKFKKPYSEEEIYYYLKDFKYIIPQGSVLSGIGNNFQYVSLSNCYVVPSPLDSYSSICKTDEQIVSISKRRGGIGLDVSNLRPVGTSTSNAARSSTGVVSFCKRYSNTIREVGQAGRRGALILTISVHHPQILDFVEMKRDLTKVTGANISVRLTNDFLDAVDKDKEYEQKWPVDSDNPKISKMVDAKIVWNKIIENAWSTAEPGLLFWNNIIDESPADCYSDLGFKTVSTNPSLRGETLVLTNKGIFPIKYLAENKINAKVKNMRGEWHNYDAFLSGINKKLMKVIFSNNSFVYCTPEHKWPILNTTNNIINKHTGKILKKETKDLKRQDKIYFPSFENPVNNKFCKYSFDDGFVLGWNLGDGWTSYHKANKSKQYGFIFSEEDVDSKISEKVLNYTNNIAKIKSNLRQDHDSKSYTYCTTDTAVVDSFEKKGLFYKYEGIPNSIWKGNKKFIHGFIDGLFSADGCVRVCDKISHCQIILTSSCEKIVSDVKKLLSFYGIRSSYKKTITSNVIFPNGKQYNKEYIRFDLIIAGLDVIKFSEYFSLSNKLKQCRIEKITKKKITYNSKGRIEYANNRNYLVVKKIEYTNICENVYDIMVHDDTHTFLMETGITGNCSELPLSGFDSCRLLLLNLYSYVDFPFTSKAKFNFDKFSEHVKVAQRFMDDIVDLEIQAIKRIIKKIENDPEPIEIKRDELQLWKNIYKYCKQGRRTGTGVNAVGDVLAACNIKYGSPKSIKFLDEVFKTLKLSCYRSSVDMAKEIGAFEVYNYDLEKNNNFLSRIKDEDKELWKDMKKYGRRNIALLTLAPSGSVSILTQTTSGIEPLFQMSYKRRKKINNELNEKVDFVDDSGDKWQEFEVLHPKIKEWKEATNENDLTLSPWYGCCASDIDWKSRVELQAVVNRHIDHSISSTINLPQEATLEDVSTIYKTAWKSGCKGITVYRDGCRSGVLISEEKNEDKIKKTTCTKRPKTLPCDIYHTSVKGEEYFVIVGLLNNDPYEVFAGKNGHIIKRGSTKGFTTKVKRGQYQVEMDNNVIFEDISQFISDDQESITRLISTALRHGSDIKFVVHQIEKTKGDMMSFSKAISRILKKYIKDGTKVTGEECPKCKNTELMRQEGCISCPSCGWTKCA